MKENKTPEDFLQEIRDLQGLITPDMHKEVVENCLGECGKLFYTVYKVLGLTEGMSCVLQFDDEEFMTLFRNAKNYKAIQDTYASQLSEERSVGFAIWTSVNGWVLMANTGFWVNDKETERTTSQLYTLYLESLNQSNDADK